MKFTGLTVLISHEEAEASILRLEENGLADWPICMAKTQASLSDDPKKRNAPRGWRFTGS